MTNGYLKPTRSSVAARKEKVDRKIEDRKIRSITRCGSIRFGTEKAKNLGSKMNDWHSQATCDFFALHFFAISRLSSRLRTERLNRSKQREQSSRRQSYSLFPLLTPVHFLW